MLRMDGGSAESPFIRFSTEALRSGLSNVQMPSVSSPNQRMKKQRSRRDRLALRGFLRLPCLFTVSVQYRPHGLKADRLNLPLFAQLRKLRLVPHLTVIRPTLLGNPFMFTKTG
jgi:hypothetical protein